MSCYFRFSPLRQAANQKIRKIIFSPAVIFRLTRFPIFRKLALTFRGIRMSAITYAAFAELVRDEKRRVSGHQAAGRPGSGEGKSITV
jgi:hypothetical protein